MDLEEARANIGRAVVYRADAGDLAEDGLITEIRGPYVFVRHATGGAKATQPQDLTLLPRPAGPLCGALQGSCRCGEPQGHPPPHECEDRERCNGAWWYEDGKFRVHRWPKLPV